jgi:hypothetical protein
MFNLPNAIPTKAFKDLNTIMGDNRINAIVVDWSYYISHFHTKEVHPIMAV